MKSRFVSGNRRQSGLLWLVAAVVSFAALLLSGCQPSPELNVLAYRLGDALGVYEAPAAGAPTGSVAGLVLADDGPVKNATVLVVEPRGVPHSGQTDASGRYRIDDVPIGRYVPAAVASGYAEAVLRDDAGRPLVLTVTSDEVAAAPPIQLAAAHPTALSADLAAAVSLTQTDAYTATTAFPPGAAAQVQRYSFTRDDATLDTLRLYLPLDVDPDEALPLLFFSYPGDVDGWEDVSVGFASQGYALAALSPLETRGLDVTAHAEDARVALHLAQSGALSPQIDGERPVVALGGSFTSAILYRLALAEPDRIAAWVTLGGVADVLDVAQAFYAGEAVLPPRYNLAIPSLGRPHLQPLALLRYSPVYRAAELPPTLIIHTDADRIFPIEQAYLLEEALQAAGVPVETFYYADVSHYLQVGDDLTAEGEEMFGRVLDFVERSQQTSDAE